jgi:hypothetical protein
MIEHIIVFSTLSTAILCAGYVIWLIIADAIKGSKRNASRRLDR